MTTNYSRWFLVIGSLYILLGMTIGLYMGSISEFTLTPVHVHINLVGFVLMTLFGLTLRAIPAMAKNGLAKAHFWLYQVGAVVMLVSLYLLISGRVAESVSGPMTIIGGVLVLAGTTAYAVNLNRNA